MRLKTATFPAKAGHYPCLDFGAYQTEVIPLENMSTGIQMLNGGGSPMVGLVALWPYVVGTVLLIIFVINWRNRARARMQAYANSDGSGISGRLSDADLASYQLEGAEAPVPVASGPSMDDFFANTDRHAEVHGDAVPKPQN